MISAGRLQTGIFCILFCLSALVLVPSCSGIDGSSAFTVRLGRIDDMIQSGKDTDALRELARLRKKASSASQWLSLVKRERNLNAPEQAIDTLTAAMVGLPANETLAAVMTDTLVGLGRYEQAVDHARVLVSSPYMAVAARAGMEYLVQNGPDSFLDPAFFGAAYRVSGNEKYLVNAAVLHAQRGEYSEACSLILTVQDPAYRHLSAVLCYDAGYFEKVRDLYNPLQDTRSYAPEELLLLSDSLYRLGAVDDSRDVWRQMIMEHPRYSPVPYFNLARTGSPDSRETHLLSDGLALFPAYYPAIALYCHEVRNAPKLPRDDPVKGALRTAGFTSVIMDAESAIEYPDSDEALRKISRALSDPSGARDPRIHIERIRLNPFRKTASERTGAMVWKLLEEFPDNALAHDFALWYFLSSGEYETCFSLNTSCPEGPRPLYSALEAAMQGRSDEAVEYFMNMANDENLAWLGLANAALVRARQGEQETALEELIIAASMAPDRRKESRIQYRIAILLESMRLIERSESVLGYALDLDPDNHLARAMLRKIQAGK